MADEPLLRRPADQATRDEADTRLAGTTGPPARHLAGRLTGSRHALPRERLVVSPPLPIDDVLFLAGFGRHPVHDHAGVRLAMPGRVARIWPGQPAGPCPWVPCADGCCLRLGGRTGVVAAAAWLRFLLAQFLDATHELDGTVEVPGPGRARAVLIVDRTDVFQGELDDRPLGRDVRPDHEEPWSG